MQSKMTGRFWAGMTTGGASASLVALTLVQRDWIELVFHVDPDRGSGALEWLLVTVLVTATVACAFVVRAGLARPAHDGA